MSLPVIAINTSNGCGHCKGFRKDGQPRVPQKDALGNPKMPGTFFGYHWSPDTFRKLVTGTADGKGSAKWRVFDFYWTTLDGRSVKDVMVVSEFTLKGTDGVTRTSYSKQPNGKGVVAAIDDGKAHLLPGAGDWDNFVTKRYPAELINFLFYYPQVMYVNGAVWDNAVRGTGRLYGVVKDCVVAPIKNPDGSVRYNIDYSKPPKSQANPVKLAIDLTDASKELQLPTVSILPDSLPLPAEGERAVLMETVGNGCKSLGFKLIPP
ncbi:Hypothetical protein POVN_LOCUS461 [uncultured virus]|nr:Hypothetical protein POVN_LOCUS461 [uncultured virus]